MSLNLSLFASTKDPHTGAVEELYLKSLKKSKQVEVYNLTKKKALSDLSSIQARLYPSLDIVNSNTYESDPTASDLSNTDTNSELYLSMQQKLFQGGAEFALLEYKNVIPKKADALMNNSLAGYYREFTSLYFQVSSAKEEEDKVRALLNNLRKRVEIVKKRTRIGRDRKADLYALESQLHRLEADLIASESQLTSALTRFKNFSGIDSVDQIRDSIDPLALNLAREVDLENTPELTNLKYDYETAQLESRIEKSTYYPQVNLGATYNLDKNDYDKRDWALSLNVTLNLLDFGDRSSKVASKNIQAQINNARIEYSRRNIKNSWSEYLKNFENKKNELVTLKSALKRSQISYQEQLKDLSKGLVTQIDVIRSLDDVISLEKLVIRSALDVKSLYYQANAFLGNIPSLN